MVRMNGYMNGNGSTAGNQAPDQIAARQPATLINTGYPTAPGNPASVSPLVPTAAGQNTAAGAVVNAGLSWPGRIRAVRSSTKRASSSPRRRARASSRAAAPRRKRASSRRGKPARLVKGSAAARRYMAKIRRMRKRR